MLKDLIMRPYIVRDPGETVSGSPPADAPPAEPAVLEAPPLPDFNDAFVQAEIERRASELTATQVARFQAEMVQRSTQYSQPTIPTVTKTPLQARQERIQAVMDAPDWESQVAALVDLTEATREEAKSELRQEFAPLIQHSAIQSATGMVLTHVPNVSVEARPFIEQAIKDMGFRPQDLDKPQNAQFVADAAEMRAIRAGKMQYQAPTTAAPQNDPTRGGTLFSQPRQPIQTAAPVSTQTVRTWRDAASREEQDEIDKMFAQYTPKGMKPEDAFTAEHIQDALNGLRVANQFKGIF